MDTGILRLLWSAVLEISPDTVAGLSDEVLTKRLIDKLRDRVCLSAEERAAVTSYIQNKKPLIIEVVQG
ncbi:MAG: hypothetical protein AAF215_29140 [Cyanobacteria bacterium P01_A01_bin.123]